MGDAKKSEATKQTHPPPHRAHGLAQHSDKTHPSDGDGDDDHRGVVRGGGDRCVVTGCLAKGGRGDRMCDDRMLGFRRATVCVLVLTTASKSIAKRPALQLPPAPAPLPA